MQAKNLPILGIILVFGYWHVYGNPSEPVRYFYPYGNYIRKFEQKIKPQVEQVTLQAKESFDSDAKINRKGILVRYPNAQANVVICHGFMCDKFDVGFLRQIFPIGKYNFLTFDFRAHGEDTQGQCCTFGRDEANDVIAAANYFKQHSELSKLPTLVYAFSMGAVASIEAQAKDSSLFKAMILDCPFDSTENIVKKALQNLKFSFFGYQFDLPGRQYLEKYAFHPYVQSFIKVLLKTVPHIDAKNIKTYMYRFSPSLSITKINVPCLFIHCKHDQRVEVDAIHTLYNGAQGPKRLWVTEGRGHYDSIFYNPEKYAKQVSKFFDMVLDGRIFKGPREKITEDIIPEQEKQQSVAKG
jgi:pimeloyl-ACP methyl ester carboxylesterase